MENQTLYSFLDKLQEKHPGTTFVATVVTQNGDSGGQFLPDEELILSKVDEEDDDDNMSEFWGSRLWIIFCRINTQNIVSAKEEI